MPLKIKSQTVFATYIILPGINAGELEEKTFMESRVLYNERGKTISHSKFFPTGALKSSLEKKYDDKDNLTEELHFISEIEPSERKTFKYDENNLPVAEYIHYLDNSFDSTLYIYDKNNILVEKRTYDNDNQLELRIEYHYRDHFPSGIISFDPDGKISGKEIFNCDSKGNLLEKIVIGQDETSEITQNQYDDSDRLIKSIRKNNFEISMSTYQYDPGGNIVEEALYSGEKLTRKTVFIYDENNLLNETSELFFVPGFSIEQNIIRKIEYEFY